MFTRAEVTSRPSTSVPDADEPDDLADSPAMIPPSMPAATKNMPTNSRPLPMKIVAKKRSSCRPPRSLITPRNHRKAIPANGPSFSATSTVVRRAESFSQAPAWPGSDGVDRWISTSDAIVSTENAMPATAAARGVLSGLTICDWSASIVWLVISLSSAQGDRLLGRSCSAAAEQLRLGGRELGVGQGALLVQLVQLIQLVEHGRLGHRGRRLARLIPLACLATALVVCLLLFHGGDALVLLVLAALSLLLFLRLLGRSLSGLLPRHVRTTADHGRAQQRASPHEHVFLLADDVRSRAVGQLEPERDHDLRRCRHCPRPANLGGDRAPTPRPAPGPPPRPPLPAARQPGGRRRAARRPGPAAWRRSPARWPPARGTRPGERRPRSARRS